MAAASSSRSSITKLTQNNNKLFRFHFCRLLAAKPPYASSFNSTSNINSSTSANKLHQETDTDAAGAEEYDAVPISRPLSHILKELNKKVPDSLLRVRKEPDGFSVKYIPWHIVNRIMNLHAPEWSGEVRSITYSADGKSVSVVYRVTIYGTDAERINRDCFSWGRGLWGCCAKGRSNGISSSLCPVWPWTSSVS